MQYRYLPLVVLLLLSQIFPGGTARGQQYESTGLGKFEVGLNTSWIVYQGDLRPTKFGDYKRGNMGFGAQISYALIPRLDLCLEVVSTQLDEREGHYGGWRARRDFRFSTPLTYIGAGGRFYVTNRYKPEYGGTERLLSVYVTGGLGMAFFNPRTSWDNLDRLYFNEERLTDGLTTDSLGDHDNKALFLSAGAGVRLNLSPRINVYSTLVFRQLFTDYLDGFHESCNGGNDSFTSLSVGLSFLLATEPAGGWNRRGER